MNPLEIEAMEKRWLGKEIPSAHIHSEFAQCLQDVQALLTEVVRLRDGISTIRDNTPEDLIIRVYLRELLNG